MKLYHFTSRHHINGCMKEGLTRGGIPEVAGFKLSWINGYQWLTTNSSFDDQKWEKPSGILKYRRNEYRITIKIPKAKRQNLIKWTDFIKEMKLNITEHLNAFGGHEDWYLYHGKVKPKWFRNIDKNPKTRADLGPLSERNHPMI